MLPLKKIILYKHGVGYFERQGQVTGDAQLDLHFRAAEMNDVLKSLTTLDLDGGHVSSVSYESTKPVQKQLDDISLSLADQNTVSALVSQIKGAQVEIAVGDRKVSGVVTGLESVPKAEKETVYNSNRIALLIGGDAIQTFDHAEVTSLRLVDEGVRKDLQHLLDILIGAKKKDLKRLTIFARGDGKRRVIASYLLETPVWKTSYRTLLRSNKKPLVQGWALVDNTQDEDWDDVRLSLVAGLPISFVHDLYSPRYKRRPIVQIREEEAYAPPELEAAVSTEDLSEMDEMGAAPCEPAATPARRQIARGRAGASMAMDMDAERREAAASSVKVRTSTAEVGDLFQYEIKNPVTVKRNQSALVPILQEPFEGRRVAAYNPEIRDKNPMSAILFRNTTGMTLEGGPMTVLEDETYVGESMLDTLKPDEERLIPFSVELGCVITVDHRSDLQDVHFARIVNGTLHLYRFRIQRRIYMVNNKTDRKIDLFLEHRFTPGWELVETEKPVEKTDNFYRFRFEAPPRKTVKFTVSEKGDETQTHSVGSVTKDQIRVFIEMKYLDKATADQLREILARQEKSAQLQRRIQELEKEVQTVFKNQERLRSNLNALGSSTSEKQLRERYIGQLGQEEDKIEGHRREIKALQEEHSRVEEDLRRHIHGIRFEQAVR